MKENKKTILTATNEQAFDMLADLIDPMSRIAQNEKVKEVREKEGSTMIDVAKTIFKSCGNDLLEVFAVMDGEAIEGYTITASGAFGKLIAILNDEGLRSFLM